ncbi:MULTISPECIES: hypothetical protein [Aerococcus]|uniref:ABC transporter permease n=4 Tax=Aerococcus TaxID=1375 RepID=A0A1E9PJG3_9LACT|nr:MULTISPECIES: hypothetical protein [Aerococcus]AEA01344.1 hypothetical protein HMPREF9243_0090 [Aerococcus sp. Group 1]MBU5610632.1 hypothetical protein [Aerococcus urinae]MCY3031335.1 hypothetical protein [Aerococcus sp. Group 1]MCY3040196.1 hypothetical protein [Aerococcus sp. Group 2]MCY3041919.1 hypothetical protein [Aerococcus sp. Group 2]
MNDKDRKEFGVTVRLIITIIESTALMFILLPYAIIASKYETDINFSTTVLFTFFSISMTYTIYFYLIRLQSDRFIPHNINFKVICNRSFLYKAVILFSLLASLLYVLTSSFPKDIIILLGFTLTCLISICLIFIIKEIFFKDSTSIKIIDHASYKFSKLELSLFSLLVIPYLLASLEKGSFILENNNPVAQDFYFYFFLYILCVLPLKAGRFIALISYWTHHSNNQSTQLSNKNSHVAKDKIWYNEFFLIDLDE